LFFPEGTCAKIKRWVFLDFNKPPILSVVVPNPTEVQGNYCHQLERKHFKKPILISKVAHRAVKEVALH